MENKTLKVNCLGARRRFSREFSTYLQVFGCSTAYKIPRLGNGVSAVAGRILADYYPPFNFEQELLVEPWLDPLQSLVLSANWTVELEQLLLSSAYDIIREEDPLMHQPLA
eukprot:4389507-Amphidinium_carterae.1